MSKSLANISLRVPGRWNPHIFTPDWLVGNVVAPVWGKDVPELGAAFNFADGQMAYQVNDILLIPAQDALNATVRCPNDTSVEKLRQMGKMVRLILELLPHTRIKGLGCNFVYRIDEPDVSGLLDAMGQCTPPSSFWLAAATFRKPLEGRLLNAIMTRPVDGEAKWQLELNFHYEHATDFSEDSLVENASVAEEVIHGN